MEGRRGGQRRDVSNSGDQPRSCAFGVACSSPFCSRFPRADRRRLGNLGFGSTTPLLAVRCKPWRRRWWWRWLHGQRPQRSPSLRPSGTRRGFRKFFRVDCTRDAEMFRFSTAISVRTHVRLGFVHLHRYLTSRTWKEESIP